MFFFREVFNKFFEKAKESDCIYVHTIRLGKYIEKLPEDLKRKIILDYNDSISMHYLKGWRYYPFILKLPILLEGIKLYFYEKKLFRILQNFTIVSPIDKDFILRGIEREGTLNKNFFATYTSTKVSMLDNISEIEISNNSAKYICFMGNLKYYPNLDGVKHFLKDIWPYIKKEFKDLRFVVIGNFDISFKNKFKNMKGVDLLGFVNNPAKIIKNSLAFISPVRIGAGIQGKVLEVMAMGHIVISYPQGTEGINGIRDRENILICRKQDCREWLMLIKEVNENHDLVQKIKNNAQKLVWEEFTIEKVFERYLRVMNSIF